MPFPYNRFVWFSLSIEFQACGMIHGNQYSNKVSGRNRVQFTTKTKITMNTLEFRDMGLTPLSHAEQAGVNGGFDPFLTPLIAGLVISFIRDFGEIQKGFADGYNGTPLSGPAKTDCCQ
jgi:hypothetical protein